MDRARLTTEYPLVRIRSRCSIVVSWPLTILRKSSVVVARRTVSRGRANVSAALVGFELHFHTLAKATLVGMYGRPAEKSSGVFRTRRGFLPRCVKHRLTALATD